MGKRPGAQPARVAHLARDFGYDQGWRTEVHARTLADVDGDRAKDVVAFGDAGVWVALADGAGGFGATKFVIANFGYDAGAWRVARHPRLLADVDRDGTSDLVAFGGSDVNVARSSASPPPPAPNAPSGLFVSGRTSSSIAVSWKDNSADERRFFVDYGKGSTLTSTATAGANVTSRQVGSPAPDTLYCFAVQAESIWGLSAQTARQCQRTLRSGGGGGGGTPTTTTQCGVGLTCPAGYHPVDYDVSPTCPGSLQNDNRTLCTINSGTFTSCGIRNCPSGWHATQFSFNLSCKSSLEGGSLDPNSSACSPNTSSFFACASCPPGYTQDASTQVNFCNGYPQVHCRQ
jgi:hypothetical protein